MGFLFDFLFELIFEIVGEGFVALATAFLPGHTVSPRAERIIRILFTVLAAALLFALFIGICLVIDGGGHSLLGWLLIGIGIAYVLLSVVLLVIKKVRNS